MKESEYDSRFTAKHRVSLSNCSFFKGQSIYSKKTPLDGKRTPLSGEISKENLKILTRFLSWQEFPESISESDLKSPSRGFLIKLWDFIFKRIDESIEITTINATEEVPAIFKDLGYPLTISKSSMVTPGIGIQWSQHLAALAWLCDLLIYEGEAFPGIVDGRDSPNQEYGLGMPMGGLMYGAHTSLHSPLPAGGSSFNPTVGSMYGANASFQMTSDRSLSRPVNVFARCLNNVALNVYSKYPHRRSKDEMRNDVLSQLELDLSKLQAVTERKEKERKAIEDRCANLQAFVDQFVKIGNRLEVLEQESNTMAKNILEGHSAAEKIIKDIKEKQIKLLRLQENSEAEREAVSELQKVVDTQPLSRDEAFSIKKEIEEAQESLRADDEVLEILKKDLADIQTERSRLSQQLQSKVPVINRRLAECRKYSQQLGSKSSASFDKLSQFELDMEAKSANEMMQVDWKNYKDLLNHTKAVDEEYMKQLNSKILSSNVEAIKHETKMLSSEAATMKRQEEKLQQSISALNKEQSERLDDVDTQTRVLNTQLETDLSKAETEKIGSQNAFQQVKQEVNEQNQKHKTECRTKWKQISQEATELSAMKKESLEHFHRIRVMKQSDASRLQKILASSSGVPGEADEASS